MASGPAEETAALNRLRQNPFHAGGFAKLEYQGDSGCGCRFVRTGPETGAGFRTLGDVGAQSSLGLMTAGRFQRSDGEGIVET